MDLMKLAAVAMLATPVGMFLLAWWTAVTADGEAMRVELTILPHECPATKEDAPT